MRVKLLFFGPAHDLTGKNFINLELPDGTNVNELIRSLSEQFPSLKETIPLWHVAVNAQYSDKEKSLQDGDEVAFIPPVSGGAEGNIRSVKLVEGKNDEYETQTNRCKLQANGNELKSKVSVVTEPIDLNELISFVASADSGAIVTFLGTVRNNSKGKLVTSLTYEAYQPMAEKELQHIADEMHQKWTLCKVTISHRIGFLKIGEVSVAVVVSAPHRLDAFESAKYAIERIKEIVPIWKKEHFVNGKMQWA